MQRLLGLALMISLVFVSAGCAGPYTAQDSGKTVEIPIDGEFTVELRGNPTTGFVWEVGESNQQVVQQVGEPKYKADAQRIGAGGLYTFTFQGKGAGETLLKMVYLRPFQRDLPPAKTFELKVIVGTMGRIEGE
jgi:inhibitor of cysteine peptidase